jgi:hypothetical protein
MKNVTINIDFNKDDIFEILSNHDTKEEFRILEELIDYSIKSEKRLYEPTNPKKNRYCDISPCILFFIKL